MIVRLNRLTALLLGLASCGHGSSHQHDAPADDLGAGGAALPGGGGAAGGARAGSGGNSLAGRAGGSGGSGVAGSAGIAGAAGAGGAGGARADAGAAAGAAGGDAAAPGGPRGDAGAVPDAPRLTGTPFVYVSGGGGEISIFALDPATGALAKRGAAMGISPTYLAFSTDKKFIYGPNGNPTRVFVWAVNPMTGALTPVTNGDETTGSRGSAHIGVHPGGKHVLVPHYTAGDIAVMPIGPTGGVGMPTDTKTTAAEAHQVVSDRSGAFVFVPCRTGNAIMQFKFDAAGGKLIANDPPRVMAAAGVGPRHMAFHPTESFAYVLNELGGTLTSYRYDKASGLLSDPQSVSTVPAGMTENSAAHVIVHPTGRFLYASNRSHNSVVVFALDAATGRPSMPVWENAGGMIRNPRDFAMDPSGTFLLVANQMTGTVIVFRINAADGKLTRAGDPVTGLSGPSFIGVLPLP
jgi:6-phosphogluconolactonase